MESAEVEESSTGYDFNGDGDLSFEEFFELFAGKPKRSPRLFVCHRNFPVWGMHSSRGRLQNVSPSGGPAKP